MHRNITQRIFTLLLTGIAAIALGCTPVPPAPNSGTASPATPGNTAISNTGTSNSSINIEAQAAAMPVTMPLLDAMFSEESFAADAKQKLQLTNEQLTKISDAAKNAVVKLGTDPGEDDERSTKASVAGTKAELEKILGAAKASEFINFVRERWQGNSEALALRAPNSVPTDTRVVVNAPAYRMDLFKDGKLVKTYKVGIGYPEFPLPIGLRRATEIIFNPTWTPPDEPWVKGKVAPGKKVEAGSKLNPLGPIKIPIGLPSLIHGGKDPSRIGTFASHGCVGLTSPMIQDFAMQISALGGSPMTMEEVKAHEKSKTETEEVKLSSSVPVEIRYETIVAEDGKVTIYRDVYEKGTNTEENLRKVLDTFRVSLDSLSETDRSKLMDALEQMAVDAGGDSVPEEGNSNTKPSKSSKVTRNIKGKKEIVIELAALKGKGYPAPVALMSK